MPDYLKQPDRKSKQELIRSAVDYFLQLKKQHISQEKARQVVLQKTGVLL